MNSTEYQELVRISGDVNAGEGRSASIQCAIQVAALMISLAVSLVGGLCTGVYIVQGTRRYKKGTSCTFFFI